VKNYRCSGTEQQRSKDSWTILHTNPPHDVLLLLDQADRNDDYTVD
jgi:hypothetical protein